MSPLSAPDTKTPAVVLLIHPDPTSWLCGVLSAQGHTVVHVTSAAVALQRLAEEDPDLVIVGDPLEGAETREICAAIQEVTQGDRPVVVESRGPLDASRRTALLAAGAWECVASEPPEVESEEQLRISTYLRARRAATRERVERFTDHRTGLYNRVGLSRRAQELGAISFRTHDPIACVVFGLTLEPDTEAAMAYFAQAIYQEGRASDIVARLSEREIAVLASHTDGNGIMRLAERVAKVFRGQHFLPDGGRVGADMVASYEAVSNAGYTPVRPIELVIKAATALRARHEQGGGHWIRRSGQRGMVSHTSN